MGIKAEQEAVYGALRARRRWKAPNMCEMRKKTGLTSKMSLDAFEVSLRALGSQGIVRVNTNGNLALYVP